MTFAEYAALRRRGEYLPRMYKGICPLCGEAFDVSWRGTQRAVCEACSPKLRRWTQDTYSAMRYERKKKHRPAAVSVQDPWPVTVSAPGGCHIRCKGTQDDPWTVETLDGYCYEASKGLGF